MLEVNKLNTFYGDSRLYMMFLSRLMMVDLLSSLVLMATARALYLKLSVAC